MSQSNEIENRTGKDMDTGRAQRVLAWADFRILDIGGERCSCVWATRDCPELREALSVAGFGELPVKYFEGGEVPDEYKGWPFAEDDPELTRDILDAMEQAEASGGEPWVTRDQRMAEIRWYGCWAEWKAAALNKLFDEQCAAPGRRNAKITAATVRHGERAAMRTGGQEEISADTETMPDEAGPASSSDPVADGWAPEEGEAAEKGRNDDRHYS